MDENHCYFCDTIEPRIVIGFKIYVCETCRWDGTLEKWMLSLIKWPKGVEHEQ